MGKKLLSINLNLLVFICIYEILIRGIFPNSSNLINVIKIILPIIILAQSTSIYGVKKYTKFEKSINIFFVIFYIIFSIKILNLENISDFFIWIKQNNNMNFMYVFLFYIAIRNVRLDLHLSEKFLIIINFIIIIISLYSFFTGKYFNTVDETTMLNYAWVSTNKSRAMGIFGNPNHAGLYFVLIMCIIDSFRIKKRKRFICFTNIMLCVLNMLTFSRTSVVIMAIYVLLRTKINSHNNIENRFLKVTKRFKYIIFSFISLIFLAIVVINYNVYFFSLKYLLSTTRFERWKIGIDYLFKYPLLGTPYNESMIGFSYNFGMLSFSDNFFIEMAAQFGIIVGMFFIAIIMYKLIISCRHKYYITINVLQILIISSMLSGTIHFSIAMFVFIIYTYNANLFKESEEVYE